MDLPSILPVASPFFGNIHHGQIQHFHQTLIRREYRLGFRCLPQLPVKSLDGIRDIDQTANHFWILEIRWKILPVILLWFCDFRIFSAPFFVKATKFSQSDCFRWSCIYTFQIIRQQLEFLLGNKLCCISDLMNDTMLDLCTWENSFDCLRKACQTVYTGD